MKALLDGHQLILMEAAIVERLRRSGAVDLHPTLVHAPLIYDESGGKHLADLYHGYIEVAKRAGLPFVMCTPTWRTDRQRVDESGMANDINEASVRFMQEIREAHAGPNTVIRIGGIVGCKNDCYKPDEGLSATEAERYHGWQIARLEQAGVDFLIAETLPNIEEARGIARAMAATGLPYVISFVIDRNGKLLDGTALAIAVDMVDEATARQPLGYMINCAYPTFICAAEQPHGLFRRLIGCLANASSLDHCDLDGAEQLQAENVEEWGSEMLALNETYGVKVMGGCCGTGVEHLEYIASHRSRTATTDAGG